MNLRMTSNFQPTLIHLQALLFTEELPQVEAQHGDTKHDGSGLKQQLNALVSLGNAKQI